MANTPILDSGEYARALSGYGITAFADSGEYTAVFTAVATTAKPDSGEYAQVESMPALASKPVSGGYAREVVGYGFAPVLIVGEPPLNFQLEGSGGAQFSGHATSQFTLNGVTSYDTISFSMTGSGGALFGGAAAVSAVQLSISEVYPTGGVKFSGAASVSTAWREFYPTGGIRYGGAARLIVAERGSGGMLFSGAAAIGVLTGSVAATLPKVRASTTAQTTAVITGEIDAALPRLSADISSLSGAVASLSAVLQRPTAAFSGGEFLLAANLPRLTAGLSGTTGVTGAVSAQLPRISAQMAGQVGAGSTLNVSLPRIQSSASGLVGAVGAISAELASMAMSSDGAVGVRATLTVALPSVTASAGAAQKITGTMAATLPRVSAQMTAEYAADLILTFVTNTLSGASTTFSGYPFNSFCEINGEYYGAAADGLYKLDVQQDSVPFKMTTGFLSFKIPQQKRASDFYMNLHSDGDLTLRVSVDEGPQYAYTLSPEDVTALRQRRSLLGKGLRGVYWQFELEGTKDFDFDNYTVAFAPTARRV